MTLIKNVVKIGIADLKVTKAPNTLKTSGLGSCVGVVIYNSKVAGLAHVMLPDSTSSKRPISNKLKYADTAVDMLMEELKKRGISRTGLKAKLAGGAHMFSNQNSNMLKIGERNVEAVLRKLKEYQIRVVAKDVGGSKGRTIEFNIDTGMLEIRTVHEGVSQI
ncbi:chemotaxis protein CheD [Gracilibacillus alcaliphilus]|uniref:chemotaxis protein CheD n=1 Tax=Gracilibacillus alcaliphilus TaxID=1401441 RepID=UPI00195C8784|nr:chemotaxis protein CheD [Gracilibacillus alcaliphilus]MBM7677958.1 chemotaxis protein CheD [Gracilibacillus alcaliphilus]